MGIASNLMTGGGSKPVSFPEPGTTYTGTIVHIREKQRKMYKSETLETWPNGDAKMTPVVTIQTELDEEDDDSGLRDVYCDAGKFTALQTGMRQYAKGRDIEDHEITGCVFRISFDKVVGDNGRKMYSVAITDAPKADAVPDEHDELPLTGEGGADDIPF